MAKFLVSIQHADGYDGSLESTATVDAISALNRDMMAAGARVFACGLSPAAEAKCLSAQHDGEVVLTDGPYLEATEHAGGFWILECADLNEALLWGRKAVVACRTAVEVRALLQKPATVAS